MLLTLKSKFENPRIKLSDKDKFEEIMNLSIPLYYEKKERIK